MFFKRKIVDVLWNHLNKNEASILIGSRQTGKSTILRHLYAKLQETGKESWFINLENFEYLTLLNKSPLELFTLTGKPTGNTKITVFIDEFQYLDNPSNFIKLIYDEYRDTVKLVVSGSSAFYLNEKFTDSLAGRKRIFYLPTLDFPDFLIFKKREDLIQALENSGGNPNTIPKMLIQDIEALQQEFIVFGGYPAVVLAESLEEKKLVLDDIIASYVKKDVYEARIRKTSEFFTLFRILASQTGSLMNKHELSNTLGVSITAITHYIETMVRSLHISLLPPYTGNIRSELTKMPRVHFNDTGLRNYLVKHLSFEDALQDGRMLENSVFRALADKYSRDSIFYWRTQSGNEVDFVLPDYNRAYEVKLNIKKFKPSKYGLFTKTSPNFSLIPVTMKSSENTGFEYTPLWGL